MLLWNSIINEEILPERNRIKTSLIIGQIKTFADRIKELGKNHNYINLMKFADVLNAQADNFDLINLRKSLDEFDKLVDNID